MPLSEQPPVPRSVLDELNYDQAAAVCGQASYLLEVALDAPLNGSFVAARAAIDAARDDGTAGINLNLFDQVGLVENHPNERGSRYFLEANNLLGEIQELSAIVVHRLGQALASEDITALEALLARLGIPPGRFSLSDPLGHLPHDREEEVAAGCTLFTHRLPGEGRFQVLQVHTRSGLTVYLLHPLPSAP